MSITQMTFEARHWHILAQQLGQDGKEPEMVEAIMAAVQKTQDPYGEETLTFSVDERELPIIRRAASQAGIYAALGLPDPTQE